MTENKNLFFSIGLKLPNEQKRSRNEDIIENAMDIVILSLDGNTEVYKFVRETKEGDKLY